MKKFHGISMLLWNAVKTAFNFFFFADAKIL